MTAATFLRSVVAVLPACVVATGAAALDCSRSRSRLDRVICAVPVLRGQDAATEQAYAEALKRSGGTGGALLQSQDSWRADRDAACATSDRRALERCVGAQYRFRLQVLATGAAATASPPPASPAQAAPPPPVSAETLPPGPYLSEAVAFILQPDGAFTLQELGGSRQATGQYHYADGLLTLSDGRGDVGRTVFPLQCRVLRTANGFAVMLGQPRCKAFDGLSFRLAN